MDAGGAAPRPALFRRIEGQLGRRLSVDRALASPGEPLEPALRQDMEQRFGHDFSRVRVHTDMASEYLRGKSMLMPIRPGTTSSSARDLPPGTPAGRRLLAH
jgi:hypothetical protein